MPLPAISAGNSVESQERRFGMSDMSEKVNPLFLQLVLSLQSAAMYQMGKTVSPVSGQIEKDMAQARISIDLLTMIQEKTKGNLADEEKQILDMTVGNLQMNYVDELERDKSETKPAEASASDSEPAPEDVKTSAEDTAENK
jgi:hypothetical protein